MHAAFEIAARLHRVERGAGRELLRHRGQRDEAGRSGGGETENLHAKTPLNRCCPIPYKPRRGQ